MTKYLINLVCIIGIAGAAHAGAVADLRITAEGHAYLVFAPGADDLTGYSIEDLLSTAGEYDPDVAIPNDGLDALLLQNVSTESGGTGRYATAWSSLEDQGAFSGVTLGSGLTDPNDWFVEGKSLNDPLVVANAKIIETNAQGQLVRPDGVPIYIGRILRPTEDMGGDLMAADFNTPGGRLENLRFRTTDDNEFTAVATGVVSFFEAEDLVAGSTSLAGVAYQETSAVRGTDPVGVVGTHIDAAYVDPGVNTTVIDLEVVDAGGQAPDGDNTVTTTVFLGESVRGVGLADGNLMINGKMLPINYADLVEINNATTGAFVSAHLRIQAIDGVSTVAINTDFDPAEIAVDVLGVSGKLNSTMVTSLVRGDFNPGDHINVDASGEVFSFEKSDPVATGNL